MALGAVFEDAADDKVIRLRTRVRGMAYGPAQWNADLVGSQCDDLQASPPCGFAEQSPFSLAIPEWTAFLIVPTSKTDNIEKMDALV